jgi:hypothetical protein
MGSHFIHFREKYTLKVYGEATAKNASIQRRVSWVKEAEQ